jgi:hypothetical protein
MMKRQQASIILAVGIAIGAIALVAFTHYTHPNENTWFDIVILNPWTGHSVSFSFP